MKGSIPTPMAPEANSLGASDETIYIDVELARSLLFWLTADDDQEYLTGSTNLASQTIAKENVWGDEVPVVPASTVLEKIPKTRVQRKKVLQEWEGHAHALIKAEVQTKVSLAQREVTAAMKRLVCCGRDKKARELWKREYEIRAADLCWCIELQEQWKYMYIEVWKALSPGVEVRRMEQLSRLYGTIDEDGELVQAGPSA